MTRDALKILCFLALGMFLASAQRSPRDSILSLESTLNKCWNTHDLSTAHRLIAQDFRGISGSGHILTKADVLKAIKTNDEGSTEVADERVKFSGQIAIYTALITDHAAKENTSIRTRVTDTWEHRDKTWVLIASQETVVKD